MEKKNICSNEDIFRMIIFLEKLSNDVMDESYQIWKAGNNMAMPWLINSMKNEMGENFLYQTAEKIWDAGNETSWSFEIQGKLHAWPKKSEMAVSKYFSMLTMNSQKFDLYENNDR